MQSMTGFGSYELAVSGLGKIGVELRSSNHKFLETIFHLPDGLLSLEDKIKKEIEAKIKRGRVTCVVTLLEPAGTKVEVNKALLKDYIVLLKNIKKTYALSDEISINTLVHLPGILSLEQKRIAKEKLWSRLKILLKAALENLIKMRKTEGAALARFLNKRGQGLKADVAIVKLRFKKVIAERTKALNTDEERSSFLKEADITEEVKRLDFHIRNFSNTLSKSGAIGKELDFIAQEMQREANTLAAKTFDVGISAKVIEIRSQIEKIREQVQNIE